MGLGPRTEIAKRVKDTGSAFQADIFRWKKLKEKQADGVEKTVQKELVVNRTDGIAHVGSAALDNGELL